MKEIGKKPEQIQELKEGLNKLGEAIEKEAKRQREHIKKNNEQNIKPVDPSTSKDSKLEYLT